MSMKTSEFVFENRYYYQNNTITTLEMLWLKFSREKISRQTASRCFICSLYGSSSLLGHLHTWTMVKFTTAIMFQTVLPTQIQFLTGKRASIRLLFFPYFVMPHSYVPAHSIQMGHSDMVRLIKQGANVFTYTKKPHNFYLVT